MDINFECSVMRKWNLSHFSESGLFALRKIKCQFCVTKMRRARRCFEHETRGEETVVCVRVVHHSGLSFYSNACSSIHERAMGTYKKKKMSEYRCLYLKWLPYCYKGRTKWDYAFVAHFIKGINALLAMKLFEHAKTSVLLKQRHARSTARFIFRRATYAVKNDCSCHVVWVSSQHYWVAWSANGKAVLFSFLNHSNKFALLTHC